MPLTSAHSAATFDPDLYQWVLDYDLPTTANGFSVPAYGVNCELDRRAMDTAGNITRNGEHNKDGKCCLVGLRTVARVTIGATGVCAVCGQAFLHGSVIVHRSSKEYIHIGHTCWDKADGGRAAYSRVVALAIANGERQAFLAKHPGLEEALKNSHRIIVDIAGKFQKYRSLSKPTVDLVFKIAAQDEEKHVPAPTGKALVCGVLVSTKKQVIDGRVRDESKDRITVKITTPEGSWLAWGTLPARLVEQAREQLDMSNGLAAALRGSEVEFTATLQHGSDPHFAFFSYPSKVKLLKSPNMKKAA